MSSFADLPSHGLFLYLDGSPAEHPDLCHAWIAALLEDLKIEAGELQISTRNQLLRFRKFKAKVIDEAIGEVETQTITLIVGKSTDVRLVARIELRPHPSVASSAPWQVTLACEATRWPAAMFVGLARRWFRLAAEHAVPLSAGVTWAPRLLDAKNEVECRDDRGSGTPVGPADMLVRDCLHFDRPSLAWNRIRRLYPITLLGPKFASTGNARLLEAGGAKVEVIGRSLLVDTYPEVVSAWSPEYLAATVALRRLAWPISVQNPADAVGLGLKVRFEVAVRYAPPTWEATHEEVVKELKRQTKAFEALFAAQPPAPEVVGALVVTEGLDALRTGTEHPVVAGGG